MAPPYDFIRSLSPFIGVSPERLLSLIEKICLEFKVHEKGDEIIRPGMPADQVIILLKGEVIMERCPVAGVSVFWKIPEYNPVDLPALYGLDQKHHVRALCGERSEFVVVPKTDFRRMYEQEPIILLNLLNSLGRAASVPDMVEESNTVGMWIQSLAALTFGTPAHITVSLDRLSSLLSLSTDLISGQLDALHREGSIKWVPETDSIYIPSKTQSKTEFGR